MRKLALLLLLAATFIATGCRPSTEVNARQETTRTTRWRWEPNSAVATPKGIILEQTGDTVEATFVYLKDGPGFVVDQTISRGHYFPTERKLVFPPAMMNRDEFDMALRMDVGRVEVSFTHDSTNVLAGRWTGQGVPSFNMDFQRVQE